MKITPSLVFAGVLAATLCLDAVAQSAYTPARRDRLSWRNLPPADSTSATSVSSPSLSSATSTQPCVSTTTASSVYSPAPTADSYTDSTAYTGRPSRRTKVSRGAEPSPTYAAPAPTVTTSPTAEPCLTDAATSVGGSSGSTTVVAAPVLLAAGTDGSLPSAQVPEPSVLALFGLGALGVWVARRRRR